MTNLVTVEQFCKHTYHTPNDVIAKIQDGRFGGVCIDNTWFVDEDTTTTKVPRQFVSQQTDPQTINNLKDIFGGLLALGTIVFICYCIFGLKQPETPYERCVKTTYKLHDKSLIATQKSFCENYR